MKWDNFLSFFQKIKPENAFLVLALIYGLLLAIIVPPFQVPNEQAHIYRAYQLSEFKIIGVRGNTHTGGYVPVSLVTEFEKKFLYLQFHPERKVSPKTIIKALKDPLEPKNRVFKDFRNTVIYSPIGYIPQSLTILAGRAVNAPPLLMFYFARIANLLSAILLVYLAIKKTPVLKWGLFLLALMPMTIFELASVSYDAATISLSFLLTSIFLYYAYEKKKLNNRDLAVIFLVSIALSLTKIAYIPMILLYFLIPKEKIGKKYYGIFFLLAVLNLFVSGYWSFLAKSTYLPISWIKGVNPSLQLSYVCKHPIFLVHTFFNTFTSPDFIIVFRNQFVGVLGYIDTYLPEFLLKSYFSLLLFTPFIDCTKKTVHLKDRAIFGLTFLLSLLALCGLIYISASPYKSIYITGIQGRYFIPFFYCYMLIWTITDNGRYQKIFARYKSLFFMSASLITLSIMIYSVVTRYYI